MREQIEYRQTEFDWEFLFIGANQDAGLTAGGMGIDADRSPNMAHSSAGAEAAYESTADRISNARQDGSTGGFEAEDRERQDDARDSYWRRSS